MDVPVCAASGTQPPADDTLRANLYDENVYVCTYESASATRNQHAALPHHFCLYVSLSLKLEAVVLVHTRYVYVRTIFIEEHLF